MAGRPTIKSQRGRHPSFKKKEVEVSEDNSDSSNEDIDVNEIMVNFKKIKVSTLSEENISEILEVVCKYKWNSEIIENVQAHIALNEAETVKNYIIVN